MRSCKLTWPMENFKLSWNKPMDTQAWSFFKLLDLDSGSWFCFGVKTESGRERNVSGGAPENQL